MSVSPSVLRQMESASWIRKMFEEAALLRQRLGAENVFDFSLGNPEVEPPAAVLRALEEVVSAEALHTHAYMPNAGLPEARRAVAESLVRRTGLDYRPEHVVMTVGAGGAICTLLRAILEPGDEVIVLAPFFGEYVNYVKSFGGETIVVDTREDFQLDLARIESALTSRTRVILLNAPNNPTGAVYPKRDLEALGAILERHGSTVTVVSDEPYRAIHFGREEVPEVPLSIPRTVIATSWSKSLGLAGERIGFVAVPPGVEDAERLVAGLVYAMRALGFVNAPAIWQRVIARVVDESVPVEPYRAKMERLAEGLERIGYRLARPSGAFYLFPQTPVDDVEFVRLLCEEGILAVPGRAFGRAGHMRIALTVPEETVSRALPGFERAFARASANR